MALFENFPYTNTHELNLDWIVKIAKDFLEQYTHIQQLIEDGETSLVNLKNEGLEELQKKADTLEAALQAWYDTHSEDIAQKLADALKDLNEWYTTHENYLDQTLADNISAFDTHAEQKAEQTIATIPDDYSTLSATVVAQGNTIKDVAHEDDILYTEIMEGDYHRQFLHVADAISGYYNRGAKTVSASQTASHFTPIRIIKGQPYTFYHVYGYFSTIFYDNGTTVNVSDETWTASDLQITSAPDNGWAYVSVVDTNLGTACVVGGSSNYNGGTYYEGFKDFKLPNLKLPEVNFISDEIEGQKQSQFVNENIFNNFIKTKVQLLKTSTATDQKYWDVSINKIGYGNSANTKAYAPVQLLAGHTYTFIDVYGYFTIITDTKGNVVERLTQDTTLHKYTTSYSPANDGYAYVSEQTGIDSNTMLITGIMKPSSIVYGVFGDKELLDSVNITTENCDNFLKYGYQHLFSDNSFDHEYWNGDAGYIIRKGGSSDTATKAYFPIFLKAGKTYKFVNVYGYFTIITDVNYKMVERLTTGTEPVPYTATYTPQNDGYAFVTKHTNYPVDTMLLDGNTTLSTYVEGAYDIEFTRPKNSTEPVNIHVKTDGTGNYTSVVNAVNWANQQTGEYPINIYIHSGDYDILDELGGATFISHIADSTSERQGLSLLRNNVNLIGIGYVVLRFEMPDTVTETQSEKVSCLNLREYSNTVKNLTLIAKNCRYVVHDEAQGVGTNIVRVCENLRCIHKGNADGLWRWMTVWGGGTAKSGTYTFINCQFLTSVYHQAWSYHSNTNTESLFFNVDGCIGSVKTSAPTKRSFVLSYYGTGRIGIETGNIKNCSGNGDCVVVPESGSTGNNIEMYVNGWNTIAEIPVTGNE